MPEVAKDAGEIYNHDEYFMLRYRLKDEGVTRHAFFDCVSEAARKANELRKAGHEAGFWNLAGKPKNGGPNANRRF